MAQKVTLVDDMDQTEAQETVSFGLDGATYEIDLSEENAAGLRDALAPYLAVARRAGRSRSTAPSRRGAGRRTVAETDASPGDIRAWGRANGWPVNERGRISAELAAAYAEAN